MTLARMIKEWKFGVAKTWKFLFECGHAVAVWKFIHVQELVMFSGNKRRTPSQFLFSILFLLFT